MREDEPGVVIVFPINHMRTFFETIERLDEMRFCEALFCLDVDVFKQVCFSDLGEERTALAGKQSPTTFAAVATKGKEADKPAFCLRSVC